MVAFLRLLRWVSFTALDVGKVLLRRGPGSGSFTHAWPEAANVRAWDAVPALPPSPSFSGRTAIVTGATRGIGKEVAFGLAARGFQLALVGRDLARGQEVVQEIQSRGGVAEFHSVDMNNLSAVLGFGQRWAAQGRALHVLVNNAGVMGPDHPLSQLYRINVLAPFALTMTLLPALRSTSSVGDVHAEGAGAEGGALPFTPCVVQVASSASLRSGSDDAASFVRQAQEAVGAGTETEEGHTTGSPVTNPRWLEDYSRSKLCLMLLTLELRMRLTGLSTEEAQSKKELALDPPQWPRGPAGPAARAVDVQVRACHPGLVYTDMLSGALPPPLRLLLARVPRLRSAIYKSPLQGAATVLEAALAESAAASEEEAREPYFFVDGRPTHYAFDENFAHLQRKATEVWTKIATDMRAAGT